MGNFDVLMLFRKALMASEWFVRGAARSAEWRLAWACFGWIGDEKSNEDPLDSTLSFITVGDGCGLNGEAGFDSLGGRGGGLDPSIQ